MKKEDFTKFKNFKIKEKNVFGKKAFPDVDLLSFDMMKLLDAQTTFAKDFYSNSKISCIVHATTGGKHSENSQHYKGKAIDVHFRGMTLYEQVMLSLIFPWSAVGIYPTWKTKGLHLDLRDREEYKPILLWFVKNIRINNEFKLEYIYEKNEVFNKILNM